MISPIVTARATAPNGEATAKTKFIPTIKFTDVKRGLQEDKHYCNIVFSGIGVCYLLYNWLP